MSVVIESVPLTLSQMVMQGVRPMGEVRVRVRLTNSFDAVRFELGQIQEDDVLAAHRFGQQLDDGVRRGQPAVALLVVQVQRAAPLDQLLDHDSTIPAQVKRGEFS